MLLVFFLWGILKNNIFENILENSDQLLKKRITTEVRYITQVIKKVFENLLQYDLKSVELNWVHISNIYFNF